MSDGFGHAFVEHRRDDVFGVKFVVADDRSNCVGSSEFHVFVDTTRAAGKRAAKDAGEAKHVIDLIRIVGPSSRPSVPARLESLTRRVRL
jgi:hypothetical protein